MPYNGLTSTPKNILSFFPAFSSSGCTTTLKTITRDEWMEGYCILCQKCDLELTDNKRCWSPWSTQYNTILKQSSFHSIQENSAVLNPLILINCYSSIIYTTAKFSNVVTYCTYSHSAKILCLSNNVTMLYFKAKILNWGFTLWILRCTTAVMQQWVKLTSCLCRWLRGCFCIAIYQ